MAATLHPPALEMEPAPSDGITGAGGPPRGPEDDPNDRPERGPQPLPVTPLSVYRAITCWTIVSIVMLFSTLTVVVKARWVDGDDWISVRLPRVLYLNTAILLVSSFAIEFARSSVKSRESKKCIRWLFLTLLLGLAFLGGQIAAWRELVSRGLYLASNPGSFFIYLISGAHGLHLLGGIVALAFVCVFFNRWKDKAKQEIAVDVIALYWHFMDGLWIYLLVLLFITLQR
jgi:cytochrome c oxidase subunit 3